jgi:hypothetical protein
MIVSRRTVLACSGVALGAIAVMPVGVKTSAVTLHIRDSRLPDIEQSRLALATHDIADEETHLWRASRALSVRRGDLVTGATRWSDWIALRGLLAERGLRERLAVLHETTAGPVIVWEMG